MRLLGAPRLDIGEDPVTTVTDDEGYDDYEGQEYA